MAQSALTVIDAALEEVSGLFKSKEFVFAQESVIHTISLFRPWGPGKKDIKRW